MKFYASAAALATLSKMVLAQGQLFINTPASLVECQPTLLNFGGGTAPYFLSVLPAGQASAQPILTLPDQPSAGTYTWTVSLPAGTNITLQVRDGTGATNFGSPVAVQTGTSSACIDQAAASSATAAGAGGVAASTVAASSASSAASSPAASSASSLVSSSGSVTVTAAAGTPSTAATSVASRGNSTSSGSGNFTCTQGLLTYGISVSNLGSTLTQARTFFNNLNSSQPTATNVSGTEVTFNVGNITYGFNVTLNSTSSDGTLHQQFTFLGFEPVELGNGTILYDAFEDLTVYRNTTSNETQVQYFILGCFNDQATGLATLSQIISAAVSYWGQQLSGSSSGGNSTTTAARRMVKLF